MTYIPPGFAASLARQLSDAYGLNPRLGRDDIIAASQATWGGRFHRALARTYDREFADEIMELAAAWQPPEQPAQRHP